MANTCTKNHTGRLPAQFERLRESQASGWRNICAFMRSHPCPSTGKTSGACPGYVVDHIKPLKRGGADWA